MLALVISDSFPHVIKGRFRYVYDLRGVDDVKRELIKIITRHVGADNVTKSVLPSLPEDVLWVTLASECRDDVAVMVTHKQAEKIPIPALNKMLVFTK